MKLSILTTLFLVQSIYGFGSIWESLEMSDSKTFYSILLNEEKYQPVQRLLRDLNNNYTLFLPSESALQSAIKNNLFSNDTAVESVLHMILPNLYTTSILGERRRYLNTLSNLYPTLITSPAKSKNTNLDFQVISGPIIANIINQVQCSNGNGKKQKKISCFGDSFGPNGQIIGIIYTVDNFLVAPLNTIDTISYLPELESLENIIKSQNLSNIVDIPNSTIFAPVNAAWDNSPKLAYGMIVHSLKYQIINHTYYQQDLLENNYTLTTNYLSNTINTTSFTNQTIILVGGDSINSDGSINVKTETVVRVIQADIITASGTVIHLIDKLLPADTAISEIAVIHKLRATAQLNHASSIVCSFQLLCLFPILLSVISYM